MSINWSGLKDWGLARLSEKSTLTGIAAFAAMATGHAIAPEMASQIDMISGTIAGVVLIATKTQGATK